MCVRCICVLLLFGQADFADEVLTVGIKVLDRYPSVGDRDGVSGSFPSKRQKPPAPLDSVLSAVRYFAFHP
jgi:hypothetical protein